MYGFSPNVWRGICLRGQEERLASNAGGASRQGQGRGRGGGAQESCVFAGEGPQCVGWRNGVAGADRTVQGRQTQLRFSGRGPQEAQLGCRALAIKTSELRKMVLSTLLTNFEGMQDQKRGHEEEEEELEKTHCGVESFKSPTTAKSVMTGTQLRTMGAQRGHRRVRRRDDQQRWRRGGRQ
eukprot:207060-Rhodomonas_salina.1